MTNSIKQVYKYKVEISYVLGLLMVCGCFFIAYTLELNRPLNYLLCIFGGVFGWVAGILLSPGTKREQEKFSEYGSAIITFISGFLVAKLESVFKAIIDPANPHLSIVFSRTLLFGCMFFLGTLFVFVGREYWKPEPDIGKSTDGSNQGK